MNRIINILLHFVFWPVLFVSCVTFDGDELAPDDGSDTVFLPMSFGVEYDGDEDPFTGGGQASTKAMIAVNDSSIKDVWLLQFDGAGDEALLLAPPKYVDNASLGLPVQMLKSTATNRIVAIANTGTDNFEWALRPGRTTYSDLKTLRTLIYGDVSSTFGGVVMMSGTWTGTVTNSSTLTFNMKRNLAKIEFTVRNNVSGLTVTHAQLMDVPAVLDVMAGQAAPSGGPYPSQDVTFIDYDRLPIALSSGSQTIIWYMPCNMRGQLDWTPSSPVKNNYAPSRATYVRLRTEGTDGVRMYNIYLGADMVKDFNIRPNMRYSYNITFNKNGDPTVDARVEDYTVTDCADRQANSYVLNPPPKDALAVNKYRIYPKRVNAYWNSPDYEVSNTTAINIDGARLPWGVKVIWMDTEGMVTQNGLDDGNIKITTGSSDPRGEEDYFEISVPSTAKQGNFVVGLFRDYDGGVRGEKDLNEPYSWSWHFWVTDYNPDTKITIHDTGDVSSSHYAYNVRGGHVHRYKGASWESGIYTDAVMMDRNIGAPGIYYSNAYKGVLVYQYGRKDPFPVRYVPLYDIDGNEVPFSDDANAEPGGILTAINIKDAIANPLTFYAVSGDWTNDKETSAALRLWKDYLLIGNANTLATSTGKSLFDPCPYGWQIPNKDTWSDFTATTAGNPDRGLYFRINGETGVRYWPGEGNPEGVVFYPFNAYRGYQGVNYSASTTVNVWTSTPSTQNSAYFFRMTVNQTHTRSFNQASTTRSQGYPVRCVKILNN